ncbi:hypothetical protein [Arthrobacter woluwensis]|uniref:hypothetical protein n=1 Tax=Arthrobacter woluwensis TaxID=156980 RepID=UPI0011B24C49|nr:hypothetical protein [Arthrobacter woluwensis]
MKTVPSRNRLPEVLKVLRAEDNDPRVQELIREFGTDPSSTQERSVGEPARQVRRLRFRSGGEIILHDGAVAAVVLHVAQGARHVRLDEWIGTGNRATLDDLESALGTKPSFAGFRTPYFAFDRGFVTATFTPDGWKMPGHLLRLTLTAHQPGLVPSPEDDDCPGCSDLLRRTSSGAVDIEATVQALSAAAAAGSLKEDAHWVRLDDLLPLHASGLMERAESQSRCLRCARTVCFALLRDGGPEFQYCSFDQARRRPMSPVPPVEQWADSERLAAEERGVRYVAHAAGSWFLVRKGEDLYLDARYSYSGLIDSSALIRLNPSEVRLYQRSGHTFLSRLAAAVHNSAPYQQESPYFARDLYRQPEGTLLRDEVSAAIAEHTWIAQQRRGQGER